MKHNKRGMIMVITMMLMPICIILGAILLSNLIAEKNNLRYEQTTGRSFYLAEIGINAAYYAFRSENSQAFTHIKTPTDPPEEPGIAVTLNELELPAALLTKIPFVRDAEGWYLYESTDTFSLLDEDVPEKIRFRVSSTYDPVTENQFQRPAAWEIVCESSFGGVKKTHRLSGYMEGLTRYAIFDSGDLNEFLRGANQDITGPVHANGEIYLKPSGSTLSIYSDQFTSAGNIWWGVDATGRTNMGTVKFASEDGTTLPQLTWPSNFDHRDADWVSTALGLFDQRVQDQSMGVASKQTPTVKTFEKDGFYYSKADENGFLISKEGGDIYINGDPIASSPFGLDGTVKEQKVYNHAEKRMVDTVMLDVSKLDSADYPNGLVYSEVPLALYESQELAQNSTFVSQSTIYTLGDFNKELPTLDDYQQFKGQGPYSADGPDPTYTKKKSAAILTKDRIWHLSKNFDFSNGSPYKPTADDPGVYPGDNGHVNRDNSKGEGNQVVEVNSMLIDGAPLYDETWNRDKNLDENGDGIPDPNAGPLDANGEAASWDDYLENYGGGRVVKKRGSIVHLQNAKMATWNIGSNNPQNPVDETEVAWYKRVSYNPPTRDYGFDPALRASPPPFVTRVAYKETWTRLGSQ